MHIVDRDADDRILAGDVALVSSDAVVFRLKGQAGERLVFSFELMPHR
jgi:hypothetical protein